jgi:hypothetical protein
LRAYNRRILPAGRPLKVSKIKNPLIKPPVLERFFCAQNSANTAPIKIESLSKALLDSGRAFVFLNP